jgi:hypothetical protein
LAPEDAAGRPDFDITAKNYSDWPDLSSFDSSNPLAWRRPSKAWYMSASEN